MDAGGSPETLSMTEFNYVISDIRWTYVDVKNIERKIYNWFVNVAEWKVFNKSYVSGKVLIDTHWWDWVFK